MRVTPEQLEAEQHYQQSASRAERIFRHFSDAIRKFGPESGVLMEIGGRKNPIKDAIRTAGLRFEYRAIDLEAHDTYVTAADITGCPQIPDESVDVIYSVDVFEHINRPWLAAAEISRILRPGGVVYTSTLWSWRYHPCPIDYWRFSPECLRFLFSSLESVASDFDTLERRRNVVGNGKYKLEQDAFGGWRENWRVFHVGRKQLTPSSR